MTDLDFALKMATWPYPDIETYKKEVESPEMPSWPTASLVAGSFAFWFQKRARWIGLWMGPVKGLLNRLHSRASRVRWCSKTVEERRMGTGLVGFTFLSATLMFGLRKG